MQGGQSNIELPDTSHYEDCILTMLKLSFTVHYSSDTNSEKSSRCKTKIACSARYYCRKTNICNTCIIYVITLLASVMIHSDAKRRLDVSSSLTTRISTWIAEGMWFESHEGHSILCSVTFHPWNCSSCRSVHTRTDKSVLKKTLMWCISLSCKAKLSEAVNKWFIEMLCARISTRKCRTRPHASVAYDLCKYLVSFWFRQTLADIGYELIDQSFDCLLIFCLASRHNL